MYVRVLTLEFLFCTIMNKNIFGFVQYQISGNNRLESNMQNTLYMTDCYMNVCLLYLQYITTAVGSDKVVRHLDRYKA